MTIENPMVVDGIGTELSSETTVLTVSDHLDWTDEAAHLAALQAKVNAYLDFIEGGQLYEERPSAEGKPIRIDVVARCAAPPSVGSSLQQVRDVLGQLNIGFQYKSFPDGYR